MIIRVLGPLLALSVIGNLTFFWLWQGAREDVIEEREGCNASVIETALQAEKLSHAATKRNSEQLVADLASQAERERESREIAQAAERAAAAASASREATITRLTLEAEFDDIPDSTECLNVFAPGAAVRRLRDRPTCRTAGVDGLSGTYPACAGAERADGADSADGDFADITYGDALTLWGRDRDIIYMLNERLHAIGALAEDD